MLVIKPHNKGTLSFYIINKYHGACHSNAYKIHGVLGTQQLKNRPRHKNILKKKCYKNVLALNTTIRVTDTKICVQQGL